MIGEMVEGGVDRLPNIIGAGRAPFDQVVTDVGEVAERPVASGRPDVLQSFPGAAKQVIYLGWIDEVAAVSMGNAFGNGRSRVVILGRRDARPGRRQIGQALVPARY